MNANPPELIGQSPAWLEALEHVSRAALVDRPILVIGERGTGKELIAERLHFLSARWEQPYIKVNCAALSADLLDSELFGHEQGAFTGATKRRAGRFEQADGGTLFLDEIATASLPVQEKLLRVIEYGEYQRLGGEQVLSCNVRVVAATNVDLPNRAEKGDFRADLLDRLAFDVITIAPLRARPEDIELLADYFGSRIAHELEAPSFPGWSIEALAMMRSHDWPGNVRELKNVAERATFHALAEGIDGGFSGRIGVRRGILNPFDSPWRPRATLHTPPAQPDANEGAPPASHLPASELQDTPGSKPNDGPVDFQDAVAKLERSLILQSLQIHDGHQKKAADHLGLSYHQMRGLLRKYDLTGRSGD